MPINVQIAGFPHVQRISFSQLSDERPGRCVIFSTVNTAAGLSEIPRETTLSITTDSLSLSWPNMRVVKTARVSMNGMRTVLEDSRWKLRETTLNANYNEYSEDGLLLTGQDKTVSELITILASATGMTIEAGLVPTANPPARWAGRNASECLGELLKWTGCRMVYDPATSKYFIQRAASGANLNLDSRLFRPAPQNKFRTLLVRSYPIMYEDTLNCTAKQISTTTGQTAALGSTTLPETPTESYGQTRFRLWEPDSITHPSAQGNANVLYLNHRAKSHMFDPWHRLYEKARIVRDEFVRFPVHHPFTGDHGTVANAIELTGGGRAYLTDHPVMMTEGGGSLSQTCKLVTAYHVKNGQDLERETSQVLLDGSDGVLTIDLDWVRPVDSTLPDVSASQWQTVLDSFAQEIANHYRGITGLAELPGIVSFGGSGHVGGVKYKARLGDRVEASTSVAVNYIPGEVGSLE